MRFEHVKAHDCNPFNELADGLAKRAANGCVTPVPAEVSTLLVCSSSVAWEWLHHVPPEIRGSYPPVQDGSFVFDEVWSAVDPSCILPSGPLPIVPVLLIQRSVVLTFRVMMSLRVFCLPRSMFARWAIPDVVAGSLLGGLP